MNLESLGRLLAIGLLAFAGHAWATVSLPQNINPQWNDISSIVWSTDNGSTWGNSTLNVGQSVAFKFTLHKSYDGKHYADFIKTWIDWDGDEQFSPSEALLFGYHIVNSSFTSNTGPGNYVNQSFSFISSPVTIASTMLGDHFLLARVTCSESLLNTAGVSDSWNKQWYTSYTSNGNAGYNALFSSTATYFQGESELVRLHVNGNNVSEPGTFALIAVAMAGLGLGRKWRPRV